MIQKKWIGLTILVCAALTFFAHSSYKTGSLEFVPKEPDKWTYPTMTSNFGSTSGTIASGSRSSSLSVKLSHLAMDPSSFKDLIDLYSRYDEVKLNDILAETRRQIENGNYIARANSGELSKEERLELTQYMRTENAIHVIQMRKLLNRHRELSSGQSS